MTLPTSMTNRRKFLERSMLGFGSAFILPSLLAGCTDHIITPPGSPPTYFPPVGSVGSDSDFNVSAKSAVEAALGLVPEVGGILSAMVAIFWPDTQEDVWAEIKDRVEALVNQKISDLVYNQVSEDLGGLKNSTAYYLQEVKTGSPSDIKTQWLITRNSFAKALPHFQAQGYEVLLLPMFAQFANMYLSLLRDGVIKGKDWGRSPGDQQQDVTDLKNAIDAFSTYTNNTYEHWWTILYSEKVNDQFLIEPFISVNMYIRSTTLTVLDFVNMWAYYDVTKYPQGAQVTSTREIYSDPFGYIFKGGSRLVLPKKQPTSFPNQIVVWGYYYIDAVQLTYPANSGPDGVTQTARMGDQSGGTTDSPHGGVFDNVTNPIVKFRVAAWNDEVNNMAFQYADGTTTYRLAGENGDGGTDFGWQGFYGEALSSIYINGVGSRGTADCIVFGFMPWQSPKKTQNALHHIYITSPTEHSAADFAQAFPTQGITSALITDDLKAARQAYWASIKKRAGK